jgi:transposase-like protein
LTVRVFCEREGVKESAFYFWRREVRHRDRQAMGGQTRSAAFVEVHAASLPAGIAAVEREAPLELVLADDRRLLIRAGCDGALLARVVAVLAPAPLPKGEARPC